MELSTEARIVVDRDLESVYAYVTNVNRLGEWVRRRGLIPGVERGTVVGGGRTEVGALRRLHMTDGSTLNEEILEMAPPRLFRYQLTGFGVPFRWLVRHAEGRWSFDPEGSGTRVTWRFTATLRSPAVLPLALPLVNGLMQNNMRAGLAQMRAGA
jgi:hypothetical protein